MPEPIRTPAQISPLFMSNFEVDEKAPFTRHLNRLEVEIAREDYGELKQVERLETCPDDAFFDGCVELTERLLETSQNRYNCSLIRRGKIRIYMDHALYHVYYRMPQQCLRFVPTWREKVLEQVFGFIPAGDTEWRSCRRLLDSSAAKFLADKAGGALLLRGPVDNPELPVLTVSHGPYDPHTLEVALYFLRYGKGRAALINLGFSGREPLTDENLIKLKAWGVPLNPSNIDVIYPYVDDHGQPNCYKHEESLCRYISQLGGSEPELIVDVHGYVGTHAEDNRVLVGMGGLPPYPQLAELGQAEQRGEVLELRPHSRFRQGLAMMRELSPEIFVQLCCDAQRGCHLRLRDDLQLTGRTFDPRTEVTDMLPGETRSFLPRENIRWLPSAGANALQRMQACKLGTRALCLHVEIPTRIRQRIALKMKQQALEDSYLSSEL